MKGEILILAGLAQIPGAQSVIDTAKEVGTLGMQQFLAGLLILLGTIIVYQVRQERRRYDKFVEHHNLLVTKVDAERLSMTAERISRNDMLLAVVRENTVAFVELKVFLEQAVKISTK